MALTGFADLGVKLTRLSAELPKATAVGVAEAALILQVAVAAAAGRNAGKPIARTRVYLRKGPPASALVAMTSRKAHLLDHDTRPISRTGGDTILPGAVNGVRGRRQALSFGNEGHPVASSRKAATRGNLMWERGVAAARPKMLAVAATIPAAILEAFGA